MNWLDANPDVEVEEHVIPDVEDPVRVRDATRDVVLSFLQGVLDGDRSAFAWLDGPNRAVSMRALTAWVQVLPRYGPEARAGRWLTGGPLVVDSFGDDDPQLFPLGTPGGPPPPDKESVAPVQQANNGLRWSKGLVTTSSAPIQSTSELIAAGTTGLWLQPRAPGDRYGTRLAPAGAGPMPAAVLVSRHHLSARMVIDVNLTRLDFADIGDADTTVELQDANGEISVVRVGMLTSIAAQSPWPSEAADFAGLTDWSPVVGVRIPLDAVLASNPSLDITLLQWLVVYGSSRPWLPLWADDLSFSE